MTMSNAEPDPIRLEIIEAIDAAVKDITAVVEILLDSIGDDDAADRLAKRLGVSKEAAMCVCDAQLRELTWTNRSWRAQWVEENGG